MATLHLLGLLCAALWAGEVSPVSGRLPAVPPLFVAPAVEWNAGPLSATLTRLNVLGVQIPSLSPELADAARLQTLAPVVAQLGHLGMDPATFAAHTAQEQDAAVEMAVAAAKEDLHLKAYDLIGRAKTLVWSEESYDKAKRDELYAVAAQLGELKEHYLGLIPAGERDFVLQSELQARARFHDVQKALIDGKAGTTADALIGKDSPKDGPAPVAASGAKKGSAGTGTAVALLERMKATKSGWGQKDMDALYRGFGFVMEEGGSHRKYYHPKYPQLWTMVARHNDLAPGYAQTAIKLIAQLERLQGPALPASAVEGEAVVPPLPKSSPESKPQPPTLLAETAAPLETAQAPPPKARKKSPPKAEPKAAPAPAALSPATPRVEEPKAETPAPAPSGIPEEESGLLARIKKLFRHK